MPEAVGCFAGLAFRLILLPEQVPRHPAVLVLQQVILERQSILHVGHVVVEVLDALFGRSDAFPVHDVPPVHAKESSSFISAGSGKPCNGTKRTAPALGSRGCFWL